MSEFAFDRAGAASPFGDDVEFPLPVDQLRWEHDDPPSDDQSAGSHADRR